MPGMKLLPLLLGLLLTGCAQQQVVASPGTGNGVAVRAEAVQTESYPAIELTDDLLFKYLVSEIAGQRGLIDVAKEGYLDLANKTRDVRIVRRAAEIAIFSRDQKAALEISRLWAELEPDSPRAMQTLSVLLIASGQVAEAKPFLEKMLEKGPAEGFMQMPVLFAKTRDADAVVKLVGKLVAKYPALPEGQYALAHAAQIAGQQQQALAALKRAEELHPAWEPAALLKAQILFKSSRSEALNFLKDFVAANPKANDARLAYARMLVSSNRLSESYEQFSVLTEALPDNAEIALAAGLVALQTARLDVAEKNLLRATELGRGDNGAAQYYLGQVAEERKAYDMAAKRYREVADGEYLVLSRTRLAKMLLQQGKADEARAEIKSITPGNEIQAVQLVQAEADLLRETKEHEAVYATLDQAIKKYPDNADLLYDRAMAAEKLNKLDVLEADLRKVIQLRPGYAHAYNALGYTLAERTSRLSEAEELLNKAIALAPEDAFILDSMGWLHYRKGNLDKAREFLERAWGIRQDPEIAAHLGEVLWMKGSHEEASKLWRAALQSHPENQVLNEILKKYKQ